MGASVYLTDTGEYETYGVPLCRPEQVLRASLLIDHYLRRPEGCVWAPDANGQPAYMPTKTPSLSYTSPTPILPGLSVVVPLPNYISDEDSLIGEVVILDRLDPNVVEACVVQAVQFGQVTLTSVQFAHMGTPNPVTLEFGLTVVEEKALAPERSQTRLAQWPIAQLMSGVGRYGWGRRDEQMYGTYYDVNLLSMVGAFGGPPAWSPFTIPSSSINPNSGDLWVPTGMLISNFTDIKVRYISGWSADALPPGIKIACGMIVSALQAAPMGPQIRRFASGKLTTERFSNTVLNEDIKAALRPFMAAGMV
jgi:hypothetical protein